MRLVRFLYGHFQSEHIGELKKQLPDNGPQCVLDLKEVTLVDVEVVRFLGACKARGAKIVHCPSTAIGWLLPTRSNSRSCSTRNRAICVSGESSAISSRKMVPTLKRPGEGALLVAEEFGTNQRGRPARF